MAEIQVGIDQYQVGGFAHDAAQNVTTTAAELVDVVENLPARLNPDDTDIATATQAFWDGVGALATANGYTPA
ncbi:hypothetical protein GCM10027447_12460 [Glycomyces halotolerans]